jgi:hypothetical protein
VNALLSEYSEKYGLRFIDLGLSICETEFCPVTVDGKPLYFDEHHLSSFGSNFVVQKNADRLE